MGCSMFCVNTNNPSMRREVKRKQRVGGTPKKQKLEVDDLKTLLEDEIVDSFNLGVLIQKLVTNSYSQITNSFNISVSQDMRSIRTKNIIIDTLNEQKLLFSKLYLLLAVQNEWNKLVLLNKLIIWTQGCKLRVVGIADSMFWYNAHAETHSLKKINVTSSMFVEQEVEHAQSAGLKVDTEIEVLRNGRLSSLNVTSITEDGLVDAEIGSYAVCLRYSVKKEGSMWSVISIKENERPLAISSQLQNRLDTINNDSHALKRLCEKIKNLHSLSMLIKLYFDAADAYVQNLFCKLETNKFMITPIKNILKEKAYLNLTVGKNYELEVSTPFDTKTSPITFRELTREFASSIEKLMLDTIFSSLKDYSPQRQDCYVSISAFETVYLITNDSLSSYKVATKNSVSTFSDVKSVVGYIKAEEEAYKKAQYVLEWTGRWQDHARASRKSLEAAAKEPETDAETPKEKSSGREQGPSAAVKHGNDYTQQNANSAPFCSSIEEIYKEIRTLSRNELFQRCISSVKQPLRLDSFDVTKYVLQRISRHAFVSHDVKRKTSIVHYICFNENTQRYITKEQVEPTLDAVKFEAKALFRLNDIQCREADNEIVIEKYKSMSNVRLVRTEKGFSILCRSGSYHCLACNVVRTLNRINLLYENLEALLAERLLMVTLQKEENKFRIVKFACLGSIVEIHTGDNGCSAYVCRENKRLEAFFNKNVDVHIRKLMNCAKNYAVLFERAKELVIEPDLQLSVYGLCYFLISCLEQDRLLVQFDDKNSFLYLQFDDAGFVYSVDLDGYVIDLKDNERLIEICNTACDKR